MTASFNNLLDFADLGYTLDANGDAVAIRPGSRAGDFIVTSMTVQAPQAVPEPATLTLLGLGMMGMRIARRQGRGYLLKSNTLFITQRSEAWTRAAHT